MLERYKESFRARIVLLVTIATVLPLSLAGFVFWQILDKQMSSIFENRLESSLETFSIILSNKKTELQRGLSRVAADNTLQMTIDLEITPQLSKYINKQLTVMGFHALNVYDSNLNLIAHTGQESNLANVLLEEDLSDIVLTSDGHLVLFQSVPVVKDQKILAYIFAGVDLIDKAFLDQVHAAVKNEFIIYYNNKFVHSDIDKAAQQNDIANLRTSKYLKIDTNTYQTKYKSWFLGGHDLSFVALQSLKVLRRSFWFMAMSIGLAFVLICAAMLFVFRLLIREMLKPVNKLAKEALAIEQGRWPVLDLDCNRNDEFGVLNKSFINMYDSINTYKNNLEALVDERTEELKIAKEDAEKATMYAKKASESKSQFLANISHEIRTPLNCILGFSDVISQSEDLEQVRDNSQFVVKESQHLLSLINMLLDHSKIESGKMELEYLVFDIRNVLEDIVNTVRPLAEKKSVMFTVEDYKLKNHIFIGDSLRLRQIIMNLLSNAIKFTSEGQVRIVLEDELSSDGRIKLNIKVYDTGVGISPSKQSSIFESFTQADGSTSREFGGTGLGTTISKELVELMDGQIGFESAEGLGTKFYFHVLLDPADEMLVESIEKKEEDLSSLNLEADILLAEDYMPNQELVRAYLKNTGYTLRIVSDGQAALKILNKRKFDLVIMDVQMPRLNGYKTTESIRAAETLNTDVTIIGMTASADKESIDRCIEVGMNDVITKPIVKEDFLNKLDFWIAKLDDSFAVSEEELPVDDSDEQMRIFDFDHAVAQVGGDSSLLLKVANMFLDTCSEHIVIMNEALDESNYTKIAKEAHKIKGTSANIGACVVSSRAMLLEKSAQEENLKLVKELIALLDHDFKDLRFVVDSY